MEELLAQCRDYKEQYGTNSWELHEQVDALKQVARMYKIIVAHRPKLARLIAEDAGPSSSFNPDTSVRIIDRHSQEFLY